MSMPPDDKRGFISLCLYISVVVLLLSCANSPSKTHGETELRHTYDSLLATELGADKYGMKKYVIAFLYAGPNRDQDSATAASLQRAHMDNISRMAEEGSLVLAGPMMDGGPLKGIYVFNVETPEEAKALTETDPAIQAGRLIMDLHPWYGSATLPLIKEWHEKVVKEKI